MPLNGVNRPACIVCIRGCYQAQLLCANDWRNYNFIGKTISLARGGATPRRIPRQPPDPPTCQSPGNPDTTSRGPPPGLEARQSRVTVGPEPARLKCNRSSDWLAVGPDSSRAPPSRFVIASLGEGGASQPRSEPLTAGCARGRR